MIKPLPEFAAEGTLRVVTRNVANKSEGVHTIQIGQELHISTKLLDNFCFKSPTSFTYDLMTVIGAVVYADCLIHRHHSDGWARAIKIQLPVYQLGKWRDPAVTAALKDCIDYLTGDSWQFEFRPRKERANSFAQEHLVKSPDREYVFIPYSDGLDSYAQLKLLLHREPQTEAIGVFTDRRSTEKTWNAFCRTSLKEPVLAVPVPVYIDKPIHAEPSFRSRPFMFYLIAAYGAYLNGASRVLIPENGQGSLGGSLIPLGHEAMHRSCYPGFTKKLSALLERLTDHAVEFIHPGLFETKGRVMSALSSIEDPNNWFVSHRSCSQDARHAHVDGRLAHCGVCGNCLLRRVSAHAAGINDESLYLFADIQAPTLEASAGKHRPTAMRAFSDLANNSVTSMKRFAALATGDESTRWRMAADLARYDHESPAEKHEKLLGLLVQHQKEWDSFLSICGGHSWISKIEAE